MQEIELFAFLAEITRILSTGRQTLAYVVSLRFGSPSAEVILDSELNAFSVNVILLTASGGSTE